jgi:hypothetical protein
MNKRLDWVAEGGIVWRVDMFGRWKSLGVKGAGGVN